MAWYDKIVEVGNTAVEFLRNDTCLLYTSDAADE